jgi:hypothetical protein
VNLDEDEAEALFPSDRGEDVNLSGLEFYMTIDQQEDGVRIEFPEDTFDLTDAEVETMLEECDLDSIWYALSNKFKVLEHLRTHR